jgi:hypothetical protein
MTRLRTDQPDLAPEPKPPITDLNQVQVMFRGRSCPRELTNTIVALKVAIQLIGEAEMAVMDVDGVRQVSVADLSPAALAHCLAFQRGDAIQVAAQLAALVR